MARQDLFHAIYPQASPRTDHSLEKAQFNHLTYRNRARATRFYHKQKPMLCLEKYCQSIYVCDDEMHVTLMEIYLQNVCDSVTSICISWSITLCICRGKGSITLTQCICVNPSIFYPLMGSCNHVSKVKYGSQNIFTLTHARFIQFLIRQIPA